MVLPDLETRKLGSERGTRLPKVTQLFRDKEGIQIQPIRLQTPFLCKTLGQKRLDLWGILTPPSAWMVEPGAAYAQRPAGTRRNSASTPFVSTHVCSPNPAPGLSHIFRHLIRARLISAAWSLALAELSAPHVGFQPGRCSGHSSLSCSSSVETLGTPSISEVTHLGYLSIKARPGPACHIGSWWGGEESLWGWTALGVRSRDEASAGDI